MECLGSVNVATLSGDISNSFEIICTPDIRPS